MTTDGSKGASRADTIARLKDLLASAEESARAGSVEPGGTGVSAVASAGEREAEAGVNGDDDDSDDGGVGRVSASSAIPEQITDEATAYDIGLRRLSVRARSAVELRRDLASRHVAPSTVDAVLARLERSGLIDDSQFARQWVEERRQRKALSSARLKQELVAKGVGSDAIALAVADADSSEIEVAQEFARRRIRSMSGHDRETIMRRLSGQLARRGFPQSVVRRVVLAVVDEQEES